MLTTARSVRKGTLLPQILFVTLLVFAPATSWALSGDPNVDVPGTLTVTGTSTLNGATSVNNTLNVTGTTTTAGISNTGDITNTGNVGTATLSTTGAATLNSATVTTTLDVTGATTTNGLTNTGNIGTDTLSTTGLATLDSASITNNASVGGTLDVTGATSLGSTLNVIGISTMNNDLYVDSNGATPGGGILNVTDAGLIAVADSNNDPTDGRGNLSLTETSASLTVTNASGNTHGLTVTDSATTLSGGTSSTTLTLNDSGATFSNTATGGPTRVTGVADGSSDYDAVNYKQLKNVEDRAYQGISAVSALVAIPPPASGKNYSVGLGYGYYRDNSAVALGAKANIYNGISVAAGVGMSVQGSDSVTANAGVGYSW